MYIFLSNQTMSEVWVERCYVKAALFFMQSAPLQQLCVHSHRRKLCLWFSVYILLRFRADAVKSNPYQAHVPLCLAVSPTFIEDRSCIIHYVPPSAAGTPSSSCSIPWEWLGNCWLSMQRCRTCRRQACTPSLCPTSTTSLSTTTPSSSSSWSPTSPVSRHLTDVYDFPLFVVISSLFCDYYLAPLLLVSSLQSVLVHSECSDCQWHRHQLCMCVCTLVKCVYGSSDSHWCQNLQGFSVTFIHSLFFLLVLVPQWIHLNLKSSRWTWFYWCCGC